MNLKENLKWIARSFRTIGRDEVVYGRCPEMWCPCNGDYMYFCGRCKEGPGADFPTLGVVAIAAQEHAGTHDRAMTTRHLER